MITYELTLQCYLDQWKSNLKDRGNIVRFCIGAFILGLGFGVFFDCLFVGVFCLGFCLGFFCCC